MVRRSEEGCCQEEGCVPPKKKVAVREVTPPTQSARDARAEARELRRISEVEKPEAPKLKKPKKAEPVKEKVVFKEVNKKAVKRVVDKAAKVKAKKN